ncbi:MAG: pilus assembly protein [Alphaproteobacteria bacterium]|nr:pilus assembly protein [Alphaproteobacteria bacterium]
MFRKNLYKKLLHQANALKSNQNGVAYLEFALILPLLLTLLVGSIEVTRLVLFNQKMENATANIADVVTRLDSETVTCSGPRGLKDVRENLLVEMMRPYDFNENGGSMIVSAIEAHYVNPNQPNDNETLRQTVAWQWQSGGNASRIGAEGSPASGAEWPLVFRRSPNDGGMYNNDRVIAVETFYDYKPIFPGVENFLDIDAVTQVYKKAFYRARFGKMSQLADDCS